MHAWVILLLEIKDEQQGVGENVPLRRSKWVARQPDAAALKADDNAEAVINPC
jgi:hypothetical protein